MTINTSDIAKRLFNELQQTEQENSTWHKNSITRQKTQLTGLDQKLINNLNDKRTFSLYRNLYLEPLLNKADLIHKVWDATYDVVPNDHLAKDKEAIRVALVSLYFYGTTERVKKATCYNYSRINKYELYLVHFILQAANKGDNLPFKRPKAILNILSLISLFENFKKFCAKNGKVSSGEDDYFRAAYTNRNRNSTTIWNPRWFAICTDNQTTYEMGIEFSMKSFTDCLELIYNKTHVCADFPTFELELLAEHSNEYYQAQQKRALEQQRKQQQQQSGQIRALQEQKQQQQQPKILVRDDPSYIQYVGKQAVCKQQARLLQQEEMKKIFQQMKTKIEQDIRKKIETEYKELVKQQQFQHTTALKDIKERNKTIKQLKTENNLLKRRLIGCKCSPPPRKRHRRSDS